MFIDRDFHLFGKIQVKRQSSVSDLIIENGRKSYNHVCHVKLIDFSILEWLYLEESLLAFARNTEHFL